MADPDPLNVADINAETLIPFNQGTWTMEEFFHHHNVHDVRVVWNRMSVIERFNFNDRVRGAIGIHGRPGYQVSIRVKEWNRAHLLNLPEIRPWEVVLSNIEARVNAPRTSFCLRMTGNRRYRGLTLGSHESWLQVLQASRALAMAGDGPTYVKIQLDYINPNTQNNYFPPLGLPVFPQPPPNGPPLPVPPAGPIPHLAMPTYP